MEHMNDAIPPRATLGEYLLRAMRLRCPRCGKGKLFVNWFSMHETCSECKLRYERAPGYFLGSAYINYGVVAVLLTAVYFILHAGFRFTNQQLAAPLVAFLTAFALYFFRYARSLWIALDCFFDPEGFDPDKD
jgi:uncharacterized protein (DUF983 family)